MDGENQCIALMGAAASGKSFLARKLHGLLCVGSAGGGCVEELLQRGAALLDMFGSTLPAVSANEGPRTPSSCFCRATQFHYRM